MMEFIFIFFGFMIGCGVSYFYKNKKFSADDYVSRELFDEEKKRALDLNEEKLHLSREIAKYNEKISYQENMLKKEKALMDEQYGKMREQFENLANEILDKKSEKFVKINQSNMDQILKPLGENIDQFKKSIQEKYEKEIKERSSLEEQIKHLAELNQRISQDALNLTNALKGDSKARGDWGELQLEVLLENSGLQKEVNFEMRPSYKDGDGKTQFPDCIIKLPENKNFIIDSKVSLVAYDRLVNADDPDDEKQFLKEHVESLRRHVDDLSGKNYQSLHDINPPDYVFMFVPLESALYVALNESTDLYRKALEKNIILVSVTTLITTMRTVSFMWKQENQKNNVLEIARQSGALYDKFVGFVNDLDGIGQSIERANKNYMDAKNKLHEGRGNIVNKIESIKKLGAKAEKSLPKELVDKSENDFLELME